MFSHPPLEKHIGLYRAIYIYIYIYIYTYIYIYSGGCGLGFYGIKLPTVKGYTRLTRLPDVEHSQGFGVDFGPPTLKRGM